MASVLARTKPEETRKRPVARLLPLSRAAAIATGELPNSNPMEMRAKQMIAFTAQLSVQLIRLSHSIQKKLQVPATFALSVPSCQASRCTRAVKCCSSFACGLQQAAGAMIKFSSTFISVWTSPFCLKL
jgi:hypothetical protein